GHQSTGPCRINRDGGPRRSESASGRYRQRRSCEGKRGGRAHLVGDVEGGGSRQSDGAIGGDAVQAIHAANVEVGAEVLRKQESLPGPGHGGSQSLADVIALV